MWPNCTVTRVTGLTEPTVVAGYIIMMLVFILYMYRKQDFRELKQLQREEMKESIVFYGKIKVDKEAQERKFDNEMQVCVKATMDHRLFITFYYMLGKPSLDYSHEEKGGLVYLVCAYVYITPKKG